MPETTADDLNTRRTRKVRKFVATPATPSIQTGVQSTKELVKENLARRIALREQLAQSQPQAKSTALDGSNYHQSLDSYTRWRELVYISDNLATSMECQLTAQPVKAQAKDALTSFDDNLKDCTPETQKEHELFTIACLHLIAMKYGHNELTEVDMVLGKPSNN